MDALGDRIGRRTHDLLQRARDSNSKYAAWLEKGRRAGLFTNARTTEAGDRRITEDGERRVTQDDR